MTDADRQILKQARELIKGIPAQIEALPDVIRLKEAEKLAQKTIINIMKACPHEKVTQEQIRQNHQLHNLFWAPLLCPDCGKQL